MIIDIDNWQETNSYGVVLRNESKIGPFTIITEAGEDYTHSFLGARGTLHAERIEHGLKNPYTSNTRYAYYRPNNTVADVYRSFLALGYTPQAARQATRTQINEDMAIALTAYHSGYSAYCVLSTIKMRVLVDGVAEYITLATRSKMAVECKTSPIELQAIRAAASKLPFPVKIAETAIQTETTINANTEIDALTAAAEITAREAIDASMDIVRYIRHYMDMKQYKQVNVELRKSRKEVPEE